MSRSRRPAILPGLPARFTLQVSATRCSLGPVAFDAKNNEIVAIPKLLKMIEISGALVTIDDMGRQTTIAANVVDTEAGCGLAVKGNPSTLHQELNDFYDDHLEDDFARHSVCRFETKRNETRP